ncbi:hypothetical protein J437_LFUL004931 [Ladona fulva]|uniref:Transcriptional regulatory protein n=1 Tax=Ladona fulva TaxID=123851 RepID=A0A8K0K703_LADFU|nr:hypothetical protein J437_LFUL004931 [Ladona fulva]
MSHTLLRFLNEKFTFHIRSSINTNVDILRYLAGHSKWANIKHIKAAKDAEKSILFTRLSRQIRLAIEEGGSSSPSHNSALAQAVELAKRSSMPLASIQNILNSAEKKGNVARKPFTLEIKGPGGFVIIIEGLSSNMAKSKTEINTLLRKCQSVLSEGVKYLFDRKGIIHATHSSDSYTLEKAEEDAIEGGADDVNQIGEDGKHTFQFYCAPESLTSLKHYLEKTGYTVNFSSVEYIPITTVELSETQLLNAQKLLKGLNEHPDVIAVFDNFSQG